MSVLMPAGLPERLGFLVGMARGPNGKKVSLRAIDRLAGRPEGHLGLLLSGERTNPEAATIGGYASVMGGRLDWLVEGSGEPPSQDLVDAAVRAALWVERVMRQPE